LNGIKPDLSSALNSLIIVVIAFLRHPNYPVFDSWRMEGPSFPPISTTGGDPSSAIISPSFSTPGGPFVPTDFDNGRRDDPFFVIVHPYFDAWRREGSSFPPILTTGGPGETTPPRGPSVIVQPNFNADTWRNGRRCTLLRG